MSYADQLRSEGKYEAQQSIAKELLKAGVDEKLIAKTTRLSPNQISELKKNLY